MCHRHRELAHSYMGSASFASVVVSIASCGSEPARDGANWLTAFCRDHSNIRRQLAGGAL